MNDPAPDLTDDVRELLAQIHALKARLFRTTDCEEETMENDGSLVLATLMVLTALAFVLGVAVGLLAG